MDGHDVRAVAAPRVRPRSVGGPGAASGRADRRQLTVGRGRPAVLGGRGRGVHQRPDRRRRRLFRGRRLAHRRQAGRRAPGRWRLELRAGERLGPLVVRHHDQRARRAPGARAGDRGHARVAGGARVAARSICWSAACSAASAPASRPTSVPAVPASEPLALRRAARARLLPLCRLADGAAPDPRLGEAIEHVRSRRLDDGTLAARLDACGPGLVRARRRAGPALSLGDAAGAPRPEMVADVARPKPGWSSAAQEALAHEPAGCRPRGHGEESALPVCAMYSLSASLRPSRRWIAANWRCGSRWKQMKKSPASSSPVRGSAPSV